MKLKKACSIITTICLLVSSCLVFGAQASSSICYGDANTDTAIDLKDVLADRQYMANSNTCSLTSFENADVNVDENVDMKDVLSTRKFIAHLTKDFEATRIDEPDNTNTTAPLSKAKIADQKIINYIKSISGNENIVCSPLSFNYAMAMVGMGAKGSTRQELLDFYGFSDLNDFYSYTGYVQSVADQVNAGNGEFLISNSVWANESRDIQILDNYVAGIQNYLHGTVDSRPLEQLPTAINDWCNTTTKGKIPSIINGPLDDETNVILLNSLYLDVKWNFKRYNGYGPISFTTYDGKTIEKQGFRREKHTFRYYEDTKSQLLVLPCQNNISLAIILGENDNILSSIEKTQNTLVNATVPFFEIQSDFTNKEFVNLLIDNNVKKMFDSHQACFTAMLENPSFVSSIGQKATIEVSNDGIKASAVTEVMVAEAWVIEPTVEFSADHPFQYVVFTEDQAGNIATLFYGTVNQ